MAHNGGRTQTNFHFINQRGLNPFIDAARNGQLYLYSGTPATLDANGYPTAAHPAASGGAQVALAIMVPSQTYRSGRYVCKWTGGDGTTSITVPFESILTGSGSGANGRFEFTPSYNLDSAGLSNEIIVRIVVTGASPVTKLSVYHLSDEDKYNSGQIFSDNVLSLLRAARFGVLREMNVCMGGNGSNCSVIAHKKPLNYLGYATAEYRASLYVGATTNTGDAYSCTDPRTTGTPADKTTVHVKWSATCSGTAPTFNGKNLADYLFTAFASFSGAPAYYPGGFTPVANEIDTLVYDADFDAWLHFRGGLKNGYPPEIFIELCNQVGAHPWFTQPYLAADPITDWGSGIAALCQANLASGLIPRFEGPNEVWNYALYFAATRYAWAKYSHHWNSGVWVQGGDNDWYGKVMSLLGQQISTAYAADRTKYQVIAGTQEIYAGSAGNATRFNSDQYVAINGGSAAKNWVTHGCSAPYYQSSVTNTQLYAYAYEYNDPATTSQRKLDIAEAVAGSTTIAARLTYASTFRTQLTSLGVTGMCQYEGGFETPWLFDSSPGNPYITITGISKAASAVITFVSATNYPPIGMFVVFTGISGMTEMNGQVGIVTAVGSNTFTVDINSSGFSTWTSGGIATYCHGALITGITKAASAVISYTGASYPVLPSTSRAAYISGVAGMTQINGQSGTVSAASAGSTTIAINSSGFSTYTSGGRIGYTGSTLWMDPLGFATKQATAAGEQMRQYCQGWLVRGGEFPSTYILQGRDRWGVINHEYETSEIMDAITTFNTTTRPYRMTVTT